MGEAEGGPDPGGGDFEGRVTWELVGDGQAMVTLREGTVWAIRSSDATVVDSVHWTPTLMKIVMRTVWVPFSGIARAFASLGMRTWRCLPGCASWLKAP